MHPASSWQRVLSSLFSIFAAPCASVRAVPRAMPPKKAGKPIKAARKAKAKAKAVLKDKPEAGTSTHV